MKKPVNRERARYCRVVNNFVAEVLNESEIKAIEPMADPIVPDVMEDGWIVKAGLGFEELRYATSELVGRFCRRIRRDFRRRVATWQTRIEETRDPDEYRVVLIASLGIAPQPLENDK
jgi:hypothetical protein